MRISNTFVALSLKALQIETFSKEYFRHAWQKLAEFSVA
jgi:hypothetical protein